MRFFGTWVACGLVVLVASCGDDESPIGACTEGTKKDCKTSDGADGEQVCSGGFWGSCKPKPCTDGATLPCTQSDGKEGQKVCQGGTWTACGPKPGQCQDGTYRNCKTKDGKDGIQKCEGGTWGTCEEQEIPPCKDGDKQACSTTCGSGTEICMNGVWQNCDAPKPSQEVCDGYDNNCDGNIDEVCMCVHGKCEPCYTGPPGTQDSGQCKPGQRCCDKGQWTQCANEVLPAAKEDCTDSIDNDCNGAVNDGCLCTIGDKQACGTDVGECVKGTQLCELVAGEPKWGACVGGVTPVGEATFGCDGKDQNCNGIIDDGLAQDAEEVNDSCSQARHKTIDDDKIGHLYTATVYPKGDVDYWRITLQEVVWEIYPNPCNPICIPPICDPKPQCLYLDLEIVQPTGVAGANYEATVLFNSCTNPSKPFTTTSKLSLQWEGTCNITDTRDIWIKVAPKAGSSPTWSCKPYKLKLKHYKENQKCQTSP